MTIGHGVTGPIVKCLHALYTVSIGHGVTWSTVNFSKSIGQMTPNTIDQVPIRPCVTWPIVIYSKSIGQMPPCTTDHVTIGPDSHLIYWL